MVESSTSYQFTRLEAGVKSRTESIAQAIGVEDPANERWLFVSPHDDDACIGAGLWIRAARDAGIDVSILVVTDGRMGYCSVPEKQTIVETRRTETFVSYQLLGVEMADILLVGYPDGGLCRLQGRRDVAPGEAHIANAIGLQNTFTYYLRQNKPTRVFVATSTDLHPDHQITHTELMISLFHATGEIWSELGPPLAPMPELYEYAVYCDFAQPPNLRLQTDDATFQKKLAAITAFASQRQIGELVDRIRDGGPNEYLREVNFRFYSPKNYQALFE
jgi:LmbE family N-acetylglucosaminyl deacetylase